MNSFGVRCPSELCGRRALWSTRQASIFSFASASDTNWCTFRHSSRSRPLKASMKAEETIYSDYSRQRHARHRTRPTGPDRRIQFPHPPQDRRPQSDLVPEGFARRPAARADLGPAAPQWRGGDALPSRALISVPLLGTPWAKRSSFARQNLRRIGLLLAGDTPRHRAARCG